MQFRTGWQQLVQERMFRWIDRRAPRGHSHLLGRDKLYIFPTGGGFVFCGLLAVLWMLATNYQNNLILGLCLLLASLFVLAIIRTHSNLSGLEIRLHGVQPGFAGQALVFELDIRNVSRRDKDAVCIGWQGEEFSSFAMDALESRRLPVPIIAPRRGWLTPPRLRVETVYPLGLLRCWTWLSFDAKGLVYPQPQELRELQQRPLASDQASSTGRVASDDFSGLRQYQPGDPLRRVAWKHYAKGKGLVSKEFNSGVSDDVWLRWQSLEGLNREQRLSTLCYWTLECERRELAYGLDVPGLRLAPASGLRHRHEVLRALALFGDRHSG